MLAGSSFLECWGANNTALTCQSRSTLVIKHLAFWWNLFDRSCHFRVGSFQGKRVRTVTRSLLNVHMMLINGDGATRGTAASSSIVPMPAYVYKNRFQLGRRRSGATTTTTMIDKMQTFDLYFLQVNAKVLKHLSLRSTSWKSVIRD